MMPGDPLDPFGPTVPPATFDPARAHQRLRLLAGLFGLLTSAAAVAILWSGVPTHG